MQHSNTIDVLRDSLNDKVEYWRKNIESFQGYLDHIVNSIYNNNYDSDTIEKLSNMIDKYYNAINNEEEPDFVDEYSYSNDYPDIDDHLKGLMDELSEDENEERSNESNNSDTSESDNDSEESDTKINVEKIKLDARDKFKVFSENIINNKIDRNIYNLYQNKDSCYKEYEEYSKNTCYGRFRIAN